MRTDRLRVDVNGDVPAHKQPTSLFEQFVGQSEIVASDGAVRVEGDPDVAADSAAPRIEPVSGGNSSGHWVYGGLAQ